MNKNEQINSNNQLKLKEEIIKEEIENNNYNKEQFLKYLSEQKENGNDIQNWSLLELNIQISNFIHSLNSNNQKEEKENTISIKNLNESQIKILDSQNLNKEITADNIINSNMNITFPKNKYSKNIYSKEINCKKLVKTKLNDKLIKVKIKNPKLSNKNIWEKSYITYEIITEEMKWLVYRRYSDFDILRQILIKHFPNILIPPLPGKKLGNRRFDQDYIQKRMYFLQLFIDNIMINETLKTSEVIIAFLSFEDRNKYDNKIKEMISFNPSQYVEDIRTLNGKLFLYDNESVDYDTYFKTLYCYFQLQSQIYNKINYNLKNFYVNISAACKNLNAIEKDFELLTKLNQKICMKDEIVKSFEELSIFIKNWKRNLFNQNEIIKSRIKDFFKYQKMENLIFADLIVNRNIKKSIYILERNKLMEKKEKLYLLKDINKWEIQRSYDPIDEERLLKDKNYAMENICTKETLHLENLHKQLSYSNQMIEDELNRIINLNCEKFIDNLKQFSEEIYPTLTDSISIWTTLNNYI